MTRPLFLIRYPYQNTHVSEEQMSCQEQLSQWQQTVSSHLPHLSKPQATVLALWSYGMIMARSCGTTLVSAWLARALGGSETAWRQRLREWC